MNKTKIDNKLVEFNLYYDRFGAPAKKDIKNQNYIRIQVEVDKLKQAEPNLPTVETKESLKQIAHDISKCFIFNEEGELLVDNTKIDPASVSVKSWHIMKFNTEEAEANSKNRKKLIELEKILNRNPSSMTALAKTGKIFNKMHYLLIVYKQESIVGEDIISSLATYEQYNINYIIELKNLSNINETNISITFKESECRELFAFKNDEEIPRFFTKKLTVFNGKVVLPTVKKMHINEVVEFEKKGIVFYYSKALELIQRYLVNRKFIKAYQEYRTELAKVTDPSVLVLSDAINIENNWYHAVVYMSTSRKNFKATLWNTRNFQSFKLKVAKEFSATYMKVKELFAEVLLKSFYFVNDQNDRLVLRYNYKGIPDKINKAIALRHDRKLGKKQGVTFEQ